MVGALDSLARARLLHGLHLSRVRAGVWAAQFRRKALPSVSGEPMYDCFTGESPEAAITKGVTALSTRNQNKDLI